MVRFNIRHSALLSIVDASVPSGWIVSGAYAAIDSRQRPFSSPTMRRLSGLRNMQARANLTEGSLMSVDSETTGENTRAIRFFRHSLKGGPLEYPLPVPGPH